MPKSKDEELFMHFGAVVSAEGFTRFERVIPPGFPIPVGQVACRFRPTDPGQDAPLYQLGVGVFTANALPPYESWAKFNPCVRRGIEALFTAHGRAGLSAPDFSAAMVRYIDAFRDNLTGGAHVLDFLRDVMKIDLVIPDVVTSRATDRAAIQPRIHITMPTATGLLEMSVAEGQYANERAVLFDMTVLIQRPIGPSIDAAMSTLAEGRQLIHDMFRGLTGPLHTAMEPTT